MQANLNYLAAGGVVYLEEGQRVTARAFVEGDMIVVEEDHEDEHYEQRFPLSLAGWQEALTSLGNV